MIGTSIGTRVLPWMMRRARTSRTPSGFGSAMRSQSSGSILCLGMMAQLRIERRRMSPSRCAHSRPSLIASARPGWAA